MKSALPSLLFLCFLFSFQSIQSQEKGSVVVVGQKGTPDKFNPYTSGSAVSFQIQGYLYQSLLQPEPSGLSFVPLLAADLPAISEDGLVHTYRLHDKARWNSGKPITSKDVIFSLKMVQNPFVENPMQKAGFSNFLLAMEMDGAVSIRMKEAKSSNLWMTGGFAILQASYFDPDDKLADISFGDLANPESLEPPQEEALQEAAKLFNQFGSSVDHTPEEASCGPYLIESWDGNSELVLMYNRKFWGRKLDSPPNQYFMQNWERIRIQFTQDESDLRSMVFQNKADFASGFSAETFVELSEIPKLTGSFNFEQYYGNAYSYVCLNTRPERSGRPAIFDNVLTRRAFAHLVDAASLLYKTRSGLGELMAFPNPSPDPAFNNPNLSPPDFDIEKATSLLRAAGWSDQDDDGILDKEGEEGLIPFQVDLVFSQSSKAGKAIAEHLRDNAKKAGVVVNLIPMDFGPYVKRVQRLDFDLMLGAWSTSPASDSYAQIWHSSNVSGMNWAGYGDAASDALIEAYDTEQDPDKRKSIAWEIQASICEGQPYIFLWKLLKGAVVSKKLSNVAVYAGPPSFWIPAWEGKMD